MKRAVVEADGRGATLRVVGVVLGAALVAGDPGGAALAVPLVLASPTESRGHEFLPLVLWLGGGTALGGLCGWVAATVLAPGATTLGLGFGLAVGGGLGAVLKLAVIEDEPGSTESVTVEMQENDAASGPQPADLFEVHPDPLLYYEDSGDGPVVRAANDAFAETFGVTATGLEAAPLREALMVTARTDDVLEAAAAGEDFEAVLDCETTERTLSVRLRVAAVSDDIGTRGYVLYTPTDRSAHTV